MIIVMMIALLIGQTAAPAVGTTVQAAPDQPAPTTVADVEVRTATAAETARAGRPLICRNETVVGSRFPVRRCRPANLTPEERAQAADQLRRQQSVAMNGS